MTWQAEHFLELLDGEYGAWSWACACGASGSARKQTDAGADFRAHYAEQQEGEAA